MASAAGVPYAPTSILPPPPHSSAGASSSHLLSLKVLRAARPSLVPTMPHLYYEKDSFAGDYVQELNVDGSVPRDDPSVEAGAHTGALMLPSTFGTIYLGETFSALLSLSNEVAQDPRTSGPTSSIAISPTLKVEIHTNPPPNAPPGSKHLLKTVTLPTSDPTTSTSSAASAGLVPGKSMEAIVSHEIKELVPHSLVCTISYGVNVLNEAGNEELRSRSFRKVYKFQVSNPLSVRTKAHSPSPYTASSAFSRTERDKLFLEVQVQNQGEHSMSFERMRFDPLPGWTAQDANQGVFAGSETLLGPGAVRQYLYLLEMGDKVERVEPGGSQGLGRLDIVWRTPNGELGRLQTSMLGRRVPQLAPPITNPPPANRSRTPGLAHPPPLQAPPLPSTDYKSGTSNPIKKLDGPAPYRRSPRLSPEPARASSDHPTTQPMQNIPPPPPPPLAPLVPDSTALTFDLTTKVVPALRSIPLQTPFDVELELTVKSVPPTPPPEAGSSAPPKRRRLKLAFQHVRHPVVLSTPPPHPSIPPASAVLTIPGSTPSGYGPVTTTSLPNRTPVENLQVDFEATTNPGPAQVAFEGIVLPRPAPLGPVQGPYRPSSAVQLLGSSLIVLPDFTLSSPSESQTSGPFVVSEVVRAKFKFIAMGHGGLLRVGGVRALLLENEEDGFTTYSVVAGRERRARVVGEWDVVAEVFVLGS
ncbi:BQ2448_5785 [Microbotryum intermedium]|uniref:BQ2448_5785 protein n=1 Tax=Microbotryum intermedium TaxID=269621 RepID=A0A238F339_9BASI|nr:BQ2448_5785 [Microbotryum intermedium]